MLRGLHVDFSLAAARNAVEQNGVETMSGLNSSAACNLVFSQNGARAKARDYIFGITFVPGCFVFKCSRGL